MRLPQALLVMFLTLFSAKGFALAMGFNGLFWQGGGYWNTVLQDNPASYWRFEETSGTTAANTAAAGYPGTYVASPTLQVAGPLSYGNYALTLNGTTQYITTTYQQTSVTAYSVEAWVKISSAVTSVIVQDRGTGAGQSITLAMTSGAPYIGLDTAGTLIKITSTSALSTGQWHHIVGTWAGTSGVAVSTAQFALYVDGSAVATTSSTTGAANAPLSGLGGTIIGYHQSWGQYCACSIDEVAVYTYQLSAAKVLAHYNAR